MGMVSLNVIWHFEQLNCFYGGLCREVSLLFLPTPVILRKEATFLNKEATFNLSERKLPCIIGTEIIAILLIVCEVL